ncbi:tetratricopeptide repeat protein [Methylogaea oryzae]|nr:tetratricopeptide repeat protein [Methylogaea oryzae]
MLAALLAGCTSTAPVPPAQPAPEVKPPKPPAGASKAPPVRPAQKPAAAPSSAVVALMDEAQTAREAGNLEGAAATLERAVRMQPRNATLWYRLAELRLQQEKPQMAVDLALKSKLLAGSDQELVQKNWALIAQAKRRLGDEAGATAAERRAAGQP